VGALVFVIVARSLPGWFLGTRLLAQAQADARTAQGQVKAMAVDLATMAERARQANRWPANAMACAPSAMPRPISPPP
jgi:DNA recombination protein RmuC